ncbi:MFS transporter [Fodinicola acaciae]|uniref:MFS transporter n=1 Tax=Fodinicola acaciae TaxID=2681555 RepID=UPI0013D1AF3D|nr:MFS transporter [Fodinicola acaciae]
MTELRVERPSALTEPRARVGKLWIALLSLSNIGLWLAFLTPVEVLLPKQVALLDPTGKVVALSWVTGAGAAVSIVANPLFGALSDRTVSRFGRRHPWTFCSILAGAAAVFLVSLQTSVLGVALCWMAVQLCLNAMTATLTAAVPDRVPTEQRGVVSAWASLPQVIGPLIGIAIVTVLVTAIVPAYGALALILVALAMPFVFLTKDDPLPRESRPAWSWRGFLAGFWVDPRAYPDFGWAWICRFLVQLGNFMMTLYILYFLTDAVHYPDPDTGFLIVTATFSAGILVTCVAGGAISDRLGRRKIFVFGCSIVQAIGSLIVVFWQTWPATLATGAVLGLGFGMYLSVDQALITQVLPAARDRAKDLGIINIANSAPQVLAPAVAGVAITYLGGYRGMFLLAAVVTLLGAFAVVPIRSVK